VPFKVNAERRQRIPKQRHRVTNSAAYDAALRQRGSHGQCVRVVLSPPPTHTQHTACPASPPASARTYSYLPMWPKLVGAKLDVTES